MQQAVRSPEKFKTLHVELPPAVDGRMSGPGGTASIPHFIERLRDELAIAAQTRQPLTCLAVRINGSEPDVTGLDPIHAAKLVGDFARFLAGLCPRECTVCSKGAGTFLILSPNISPRDAVAFANRLLWEIRDRAWRIAYYSADLSCSVSISHMRSPEDRDLVRRAVEAVKRAAATGDPLAIAA